MSQVDYDKLTTIVSESGYKQNFIANKIGLTPKAFHDRCYGIVRWQLPEIVRFCKFFGINKRDRDSIFFNQE